jgi:glycerophosphoryl diester phosphodiesterase
MPIAAGSGRGGRPIRDDISSRAGVTKTAAWASIRQLITILLRRAWRSPRRAIRFILAGVMGIVLAVTIGLLLPVHRLPQHTAETPTVIPSAFPRADGTLGAPGDIGARVARRVSSGLPLIIGHRGGTERGYQNSMAAFNDAISLHLDVVETDVRHSADGAAVLMHDPALPHECRPFAGVAVHALTAAQLRRVRCAGQPIPRLADLVARLMRPDARRVAIMAEVKDGDPLGVRDALAPLGWQRVIIESFDWAALGTIEQATPQVVTCPLGVTADRLAGALAVTHDCVGPERRAATIDLITRAHAAHVGVIVWTIDDVPTMIQLSDHGVDGLITNRPRRALAALGHNGSGGGQAG